MCTENYHWHHDYVRLAWDSGFAFNIHRTKSNFDWSAIGLLDIDRLVRDRDVAIIEKHMLTVLNYCLDEDQTRILEPTFVKVFKLSQLSVQYLQFCKRYLDNTVVLIKKELSKYKHENAELNGSIEELKNEIDNLKKKLKGLKQSVPTHHLQPIESIETPSFKCSICSKLFVSEDFLLAHVKRRHEVDSNPLQTETDRLQLEIKELKERLNSTEKYIQGDHNTKTVQERKQENIPNNDAAIDNIHVNDLKAKFDHLKYYVEQELTTLRYEKHYQEKYEKWFDMLFQRLDSSRKELQEKDDKLPTSGEGDRLSRKESSTQTIAESYAETETMTDEVPNAPSDEKLEQKPVITETDMQKIQEDIRINTVTHLDQIQGALEQKLSGGFEQIQTQMNTFWKKLSDIELEKQQSNINLAQSPRGDNTTKIAHSKIKEYKKRRSPSVSSASSSQSLESPVRSRIPKPAPRITKNFPKITQSKPKEKIISPASAPAIIKSTVVEKPQNNYPGDTSDDTFEIVKAPLKITSAKMISKFDRREVEIPKNKLPLKNIKPQYKGDTETSSSEIDQQTLSEEPQVKPSNTSTLGQRSLTSLKHMIKDKDVMKGLKNELEEMVNFRLKEIGISPHWNGIPERTFHQSMQVVRHQSELSRKKYSSYAKAREVILKVLKDKVRKKSNSGNENVVAKKDKEKVLVIKQPTIKKQIKNERKAVKPTEKTYIIDVNEDNSKINTFTKDNVEKENIKEITRNASQEKIVSAGATPVKKKVLFDLEDSSSTSKVNFANNLSNIRQTQHNSSEERSENIDHTVTVISPKNRPIKDAKAQKVLKINDGGSTTSLASSILEAHPVGAKTQNLMKDDISDWDISDILT